MLVHTVSHVLTTVAAGTHPEAGVLHVLRKAIEVVLAVVFLIGLVLGLIIGHAVGRRRR